MKSAIISIGTELLFGQIVDTNAVFLSQKLNELGHDVMFRATVGDNPDRLRKTVCELMEECDLILTSGGLGPTQDDLSKETICDIMQSKLIVHQGSMDALERYARIRKRQWTENNYKQAYMPEDGIVFPNDQGTAPGFAIEKNDKIIICMPGPPREMKPMFNEHIVPFLRERSDGVISYKVLRAFGIGESALETILLPLIETQSDPTIATYAKEGEVTVRIASKRATEEEASAAVDEMTEKVMELIGKYVYSTDDVPLPELVGAKLIDRGVTISCAESCTGGYFVASLIDMPGISAVLDRGLVTYSNRAKMEELGVNEETLTQYGAVSSQTASEMARGLKEKTGSDICVSVTGIAGPDGGTDEKPVGTVFVCVIYGEKEICRQIERRNINRMWNRNYSVLNMYAMINEIIDEQ